VEELLIIAGPTAVGKSALAMTTAREMGAGILSADSMQVYRGMEIGTAQPTAEERAAVPHFLVGHVEPGEEYHVARFVREAEEVLAREAAAGRPVVVCGGTGLFIKHLIQGIFEGAPRSPEVRARIEQQIAAEGLEAVRARLRTVDPRREAEIGPNDAVRIVRALEVYEVTGRPMSEHLAEDAANRRERAARVIVLTRPREDLNARIEKRVDAMLAAGWLEEARRLMDRQLPDTSQACKALGYRELFKVLRNQWSLTEAREEIVRQTRRFAKRQMTWFKKVPGSEFRVLR
jgi:tRNA dimethylallyltransferase